ncbi:Fumitremorgin C synthase [Grifola frondosa]|uniref:Fumitremorgin C synthase n=1 Tax=Grifola frondosa TaxID=5627 RepID=A0A1C7MMQ9_GRIFR|nr:Fumitremorgin C synthase [Grifola frondosa]
MDCPPCLLPFVSVLSLILIAVFLSVVIFWVDRQLKARRLPPGPRAESIPQDPRGPWIAFESLRQQYGSIFSFFRGTRPVIEKREIYSSRHEWSSRGMRGLSMPYGNTWRRWRKIHNIGMSGRASLTYRLHQTLESSLVLHGLLESPERYSYHIQRFATSVVLSITYGRRATSLDDELVKQNYRSILEFQRANIPGRYLVEAWPILLLLPRPLQWFRHDFDRIRAQDTILYTTLLREVRQKMDAGTAKECISSRSLDNGADLGFSEVELAYAVSAPFGTGIDTTSGSVEVFLSGLQEGARGARSCRRARPSFDDENALLYLGAFVKEVTRWRPIAPFVARAVTRDDTYEGYFIPKDTSVYGNTHAMMKGPEMLPEPEVFRPERFFDTTEPRFTDFTLPFGFGRRVCPGMHVALQSIYILVARILWAFDVEPVRDEQGRAVLPDPDAFRFMGLSRVPEPFRFTLRPRTPDVVRIIDAETAEAEERLKEWG